MTENEKDIKLLQNNPNSLIIKYQNLIEIIVNKFVQTSYINYSDRDDFIQLINEKLLLKIQKIKEQYNGSTLVKTYMSVIIRNICLEEFRKISVTSFQEIENTPIQYDETSNAVDKLIIDNEIDRFSMILKLYFKQQSKLEFILKLVFRIPIKVEDFENYCRKFKQPEIYKLIEKIKPENKISEGKLYEIIIPYINKCDEKNNSPDALRKWFKTKSSELIELMNGNPHRAFYEKETIQILAEKYFIKKSEQNVSKPGVNFHIYL